MHRRNILLDIFLPSSELSRTDIIVAYRFFECTYVIIRWFNVISIIDRRSLSAFREVNRVPTSRRCLYSSDLMTKAFKLLTSWPAGDGSITPFLGVDSINSIQMWVV